MNKHGQVIVLMLVALMLMSVAILPTGTHGANCISPYWLHYSGPDMCWYYTNVTTVSGPTQCKNTSPPPQKSEATASCTGTNPNPCSINRSKQTVKTYSLSGSIDYTAFGLSADYDEQTTDTTVCQVTVPNELDCDACPQPEDNTCCKEAWETAEIETRRQDVYSCVGSGWDTGQCNSPNPSCGSKVYRCTEEGTLKKILSSNCSDCSSLANCP
jgi:hypothetical protein